MSNQPNQYFVEITEKLTKLVMVTAHSRREAVELVEEQWRKGERVLDADDFSSVDFEVVGE